MFAGARRPHGRRRQEPCRADAPRRRRRASWACACAAGLGRRRGWVHMRERSVLCFSSASWPAVHAAGGAVRGAPAARPAAQQRRPAAARPCPAGTARVPAARASRVSGLKHRLVTRRHLACPWALLGEASSGREMQQVYANPQEPPGPRRWTRRAAGGAEGPPLLALPRLLSSLCCRPERKPCCCSFLRRSPGGSARPRSTRAGVDPSRQGRAPGGPAARVSISQPAFA